MAAKTSSLVVQSKVKEAIKKSKMKCASDVVEAMNRIIQWHIQKGCERAKSNGRKTLRGADL
jgi:histone H3/H4